MLTNITTISHRFWGGAFFINGEWLDLHFAIIKHDNKQLKRLLNLKHNPNSKCCNCPIEQFRNVTKFPEWKEYLPENLELISPLHVAVLSNNLEALDILLRVRPDRNPIKLDQLTGKTGELTALHLAIFVKNTAMIEALIRG